MSLTHRIFMAAVVSLSGLAGCGGGNGNAPAAATPGNCSAGFVYSAQYGCMDTAGCASGSARAPQGGCVSLSAMTTNCQNTGQGPMVYAGAQYGCLPQNGCPVGQGAYVANGIMNCIPAQAQGAYAGTTRCPIAQVMTEKGCLPEGIYPCAPGSGFLANRCYPGVMEKSMMTEKGEIEDSEDSEVETVYTTDRSERVVVGCPARVKVKRHKIKIKYSRNCR